METPCVDLRVGPTRKVIRRTCPVYNRQGTHAPQRRDRRGQNTCVCIPHAYVYLSVLSREQTRLALSKLEKNLLRLHSWDRRSDWVVSYCTDQLLTPNFSGGTVHLVGIGGREFSVGRLAAYRSPFTESTLTALDVRI